MEKCPLKMSVQNNEKRHTVKALNPSSHGNQSMLAQETSFIKTTGLWPILIGDQNKWPQR